MGLQVADNWQKTYDQLHNATKPTATSYIPIPSFVIGQLFSAHTLIIRTESSNAREWWWLGCRLQMTIEVSGTDFGSFTAERVACPLNQGKLIRFPRLTDYYRLKVEIPYWLDNLRIQIWAYTAPNGGDVEDDDNVLDLLIRDDLERLEGKINELL